MADIRNAYLLSPTSQKHYIIYGPEFGMENVGKVVIMHRAVYGGKTSGRDFSNHLRSCMHFINFASCPADPDVWMRPAIKSDGTKCYDYVLLYVDDAWVVSKKAESILRNELGRYFELKEESIGPPDHYLGGKVRKVQLKWCKCMGIQFISICSNSCQECGGIPGFTRQQVLEDAKYG